MQTNYNSEKAQTMIAAYPNFPAELAMRVYTSQIIGREADLVLHGGGNTSVKATIKTILGEDLEVLFIKGSGWDLGDIEPQGFPALDLDYLRKLRQLESLTDEEMVNQFRTHMLDATAPNPSIETLVHAFLPHKFIDHTHADAIVTLTNQANGKELIRTALGPEVAILDWIMPGFPLAKAMAELYESRPETKCIILMHHGIFTFDDDAKIAYDLMIDYVCRAESFIAKELTKKPPAAMRQPPKTDPAVVLPCLRGGLALPDNKGGHKSFFLHVRQNETIKQALTREDAATLFTSGVLTPDHVIRTKNYPLFLNLDGIEGEEAIRTHILEELQNYQTRYDGYFEKQCQGKGIARTKLDAMPRVILIPGLGLVTAGNTPKAAMIGADIAEHTLKAKLKSTALGPYHELDESAIFDMEYWSLEQAKLGKGAPPVLAGKAALVTGGGGAIAVGIARQLLEAGARVFLSDIDEKRLAKVVTPLQKTFGEKQVSSLRMDVTDHQSVGVSLEEICLTCGGLDILVPNAGIAHVDRLADLAPAAFHRVMDVNCMGVFSVIQAASHIFRRQATGGQIIINSSKNVFAPGASFGAYSASKAAAHQLGKIAALELAEIDVRVNMINADAIFGDTEVSSGLWDVVGPDRMKSRNLDPEGLKKYYQNRNLLKTEVLADHVGNAVVFFASGLTPTTGATLPVDGGIAEAFPR